MLNHYRGTGGYACLYLIIVFGFSMLTLLLAGLGSAIGLGSSMKVAGGVILAAFWVVGFIVMQRFLTLENRRPLISEANMIGIKTVLYFFGTILCLALLIGLFIFISKLFGGSDAGGSGQAGGPSGRGGQNQDQTQQAIGGLWAILASMFLLYMAPFFNLAVLSRLISSKDETA